MNIFDRLDGMLIRQEEILRMLGEPEVIADTARFQKLMKEQGELAPVADTYRAYRKCRETVEDSSFRSSFFRKIRMMIRM